MLTGQKFGYITHTAVYKSERPHKPQPNECEMVENNRSHFHKTKKKYVNFSKGLNFFSLAEFFCRPSRIILKRVGNNGTDADNSPEAVDMNGRFQMQGGKNWFLPKEMNANRFFWDSHWLEIWSNTFIPLWDRMEGAWLWTLESNPGPPALQASTL